MATQIYRAYDITTDTLVTLEHAPNAWTSWNVITWGPGYSNTMQFDDLANAANYTREEITKFEDEIAPSQEEVISTIAEKTNTADCPVEWYDVDGTPYIIVYDGEDED